MAVTGVSNESRTNGHGVAIIDPQVATTPSAPEKLAHLQKEIDSHSQAYSNGDADARLKLLETARSLVQAMETPQETMLRYCWAQVRQSKEDVSSGVENTHLFVFYHSPQRSPALKPVSIWEYSSY